MFNEALEYFSSENYDNNPLIVLFQTDSSYSDFRRHQFIVKQNPARSLSYPLNQGISFTINSGSLYNSSPITQTFSLTIHNPNVLTTFSDLIVNFYEIQPGNVLSFLTSVNVPNNVATYDFSENITGQNILITLEGTTSLGTQVLYTSEDFLNNLVPLRQDLLVRISDGSSNTYLPIFLFNHKLVSFLNYREYTQKLFSSTTRTFETTKVVSLPNLNILGELSSSFPKEYVFTSLYPVSDKTKTKVYGKSLFLYEFLKSFYEETFALTKVFNIDLSKFPKKSFNGTQLYYSEYYSVNQNSIEYKDELDIRGLVFSLYMLFPFWGKIDSSKTSYFSSIVSSLVNAINSYSNKVLPERILSNGNRSHSLVSTNLIFLEILRLTNHSYYNSFKNEIKNRFLSSATYVIYNDLAESVDFSQLGLDAKIAFELLDKNYSPSELPNYYSLTSALNTIALNNKIDLSNIVISNDYSSTSYNPYYNLSFPPIYDLFRNKGFLDIAENIVRFRHSFIKIRKELYIPEQGVIRSNSFKSDSDLFVLPNLYATLSYLCYVLGSDYSHYISPAFSSFDDSSVNIVYQDASIFGNIAEITVELDKPADILILLGNISGDKVYRHFISSSPSTSHSFSTTLEGLDVNDLRFRIYIL